MQSADPLTCRACRSPSLDLWHGPLLELNVSYAQCTRCRYVQTEQPYWLERAYSRSINDSDTGIMVRNLANTRVVLATLFATGDLHQRVVDFAGGFGILTRLLRDRGVDALWTDRFSENLLARGFEHNGEPAGLVTAFESFEHFVDPALELDKMLAIAPNILMSTEIIPDPAPLPGQWWYYGQEHGQHIGFFTIRTLQVLAESRRRHLLSDGHSYHLMTEKMLNPHIWRFYLKLGPILGILASRRLTSKTWEDHLRMADRSNPDRTSQQR
jgi:Methyltransferase domain